MRERLAVIRRDRFVLSLALIALVAFMLRLSYLVLAAGERAGGDGRYYHAIASILADGKGFIGPQPYLLHHQIIPSAPHPPVWPLVLAGAAVLRLRTVFEQQVLACMVGTATVVMVGLAGRRLARPSTGIVAAAIAAVYPNFWLYERELMSETLTLLEAATIVLLAYRFRALPSRARAIALGLACGLLALTHAEQLLLIAVMLVPLVLFTRDVSLRRRIDWAACATAAAIVVILPWVAYNTSRFHRPVLLGASFGVTVAVSNCPTTYAGSRIGFQDISCKDHITESGRITGRDSAAQDAQFLDAGLKFARNHLSRVPLVVGAREARTWSVPLVQQMNLDTGRGTRAAVIDLGYIVYWMLLPAAAVGVVILRRRRVALLPLLAFAVVVTIGTALTYGFTRFRASAEVSIVLLAAVAIDVWVRRVFYVDQIAPAVPDRAGAVSSEAGQPE
ncbi:MAG: hypothetical protein QOG50_546 [Actinomycetota bacterium]|nr:hypothetical protein [Actinomycetota bacterium]